MRTLLFIVLPLLAFTTAQSQDTVFVDAKGHLVNASDSSRFYSVESWNADSTERLSAHFDKTSTSPLSEIRMKKFAGWRLRGLQRRWYTNGGLQLEENYTGGERNGSLRSYWPNGVLRRDDEYRLDSLLHGSCYDSSGRPVAYAPYEQAPTSKDGTTKLLPLNYRTLRYPPTMLASNIEARAFVDFDVLEDGRVVVLSVRDCPYKDFELEIRRCFNEISPLQPARREGTAYSAHYSIPIVFRLH